MTVSKYVTALGFVIVVILCIVFVVPLATNLLQIPTSTVSWNDVKEKLGTGSFVYFGSGGSVTRMTITPMQYLYERITPTGEFTHHKGKYTIQQINSLRDRLYILVDSYPDASPGASNNYTQLSGTLYLSLDSASPTYMMDDQNKSYELWTKSGPQLAVPVDEADYEIYVSEEHGRSIEYNGTIRVTSDGTNSSSVTARTPHVHLVKGGGVSAVFQKGGDPNSDMIVILFDAVGHNVISRANTSEKFGTVSITL
jgi:hypothetical protein